LIYIFTVSFSQYYHFIIATNCKYP
jgi:hypothetical protein